MAVSSPLPSAPPGPRPFSAFWLLPALLLCAAYGLLGLTFTEHPGHLELMNRCVLMNPDLSRIWSVGHIEIGLAYFGVFAGMAYYILRAAQTDRTHLTDLGLGFAYLLLSFLLDYFCVRNFHPFVALLIGDAAVMTFTLLVSKQLWFQRLLGIFVPLVFLTCAFGHFMEGLSYWKLTYPENVPWTMVTADIGFAILVNAARFPAFIRGQDIQTELEAAKREASVRQAFFRDVLLSVTEGRLRLCSDSAQLPTPLPQRGPAIDLEVGTLGALRRHAAEVARARGFSTERVDFLKTAAGEAAMNAVTHAGGGQAAVHADADTVQVWITDQGSGIQIAHLPRATLERGYSTKDSFGHGFWLMLRTADSIDLLTGATGTTVVLSVSRDAKPHAYEGDEVRR